MKTIFRTVFLILVTLMLAHLSGCSTPDNATQLQKTIANYKKVTSTQKAMAIGYAPNGHWVAGWIFAQPDVEMAKKKALTSCKEQSVSYGGTHACKIIYVNNDFQSDVNQVPSASFKEPPATKVEASSKTRATGSGVFIDSNGLILTAEHVIRDASSIEVIVREGRRLPAKVESLSRGLDVAILRVNYETASYFPLKATTPTAGMRVFTVGYPVPGVLGQEPKVSEGIISALSGIRDDASFMQISIPIQPGNSGGPVITESGDLVGIVSSSAAVAAFLKKTGTIPQNVNWATRASMAVPMVRSKGKNRTPSTREATVKDAIDASVLVITESE